MNRQQILLRRIRFLTWLFIIGLALSGATAIPLRSELRWLTKVTGARQLIETPAATGPPAWAVWLTTVQAALDDTASRHPFLFLGTDWLAFGHFVIAVAFIGALREPARNRWLFSFGMIACAMVVPYALVFGAVRGIPFWWRFVDCSFGVFGIVPIWFCRRWAGELEAQTTGSRSPRPEEF